ncbi:MAG: pentapeptide repeat-containing protein [Candidatus Aenigmarchaeota archaeon]|nr:pentapeptide repeat-containing protein [Candidatus Aenigmarchaeota archaeon]
MQKTMLSSEFLERITTGQREFDGMELHYADFDGRRFEGLRFRNCKFYFATTRYCKFKDVVFENCEFFFGAFRGSEFQAVEFIGCGFDYGGFVEAAFTASRMIRCRLSWTMLIDAKLGGLEMMNCTEFNVVRHISEVTPEMVEKGLSSLQPALQQLDFDMQQKIRQLIDSIAKRYSIQLPATIGKVERKYGETPPIPSGYQLFDAIVNTAISIYGEKNKYHARNIYDTNVGNKDPRDRR